MRYGYVRVSSKDQNLSRQYNELKKHKVDVVISDKSSGKQINNNLNELLKSLVAGDELIVISLDRLGRSLQNNINIIEELKEKEVKFISVKENLIIDKTNNSMNDFIFKIFSSVAELERDVIRERQKEGIENRKKKSKNYNKQSKEKSKKLQNKTFRYEMKHRDRKFVMEKWNISQATYYNYKKEIVQKDKKRA